jgi:hypothetical protein
MSSSWLENERANYEAQIRSLQRQVKMLNEQLRKQVCYRCRKQDRLRDDTLRMLSDPQPLQPNPQDCLSNDTLRMEILQKQKTVEQDTMKLLQPHVWEQQQKQEQEELQSQKKRQEEEAEQKKVDHLKDLLQEKDRLNHESRQKKSEWEERRLLRVLDSDPTAATKPVRVPPLTQPSGPRRLTKLPALPLKGKMETL